MGKISGKLRADLWAQKNALHSRAFTISHIKIL